MNEIWGTPRIANLTARASESMDLSIHMIWCRDETCPVCSEERKRGLERAFDEAGEDERCPDCGNYYPPHNITDEVEDAVL